MRLTWIIPAILIMLLPQVVEVVVAVDSTWVTHMSSRPAWLSTVLPVLAMSGCFLLRFTGLAHKAMRHF